MPQFELMVLLALDYPWEIRGVPRAGAHEPGFFTRMFRGSRPMPRATEPGALAARAAGSHGLLAAQSEASEEQARRLAA
jgi:hypothetical protein